MTTNNIKEYFVAVKTFNRLGGMTSSSNSFVDSLDNLTPTVKALINEGSNRVTINAFDHNDKLIRDFEGNIKDFS